MDKHLSMAKGKYVIVTQLYAEAITEYYIWEFHKEVGGAQTCDL